MATAETQTPHDEHASPGGLVYDGFISYSHAADDLLAPRLQAALQRFAKPWWKRRALRIFRDESSLGANPHLWSSITAALDESAWFILLLSPEAAQSEWVTREVDYWLVHRHRNRMILVVTDGEFGWTRGSIAGDAAPPTLHGAFAEEPRWVDLRFARSEEQLDLSNPTFSAAVADIASAIRGVPKDELESEEVRQHRRTARTAWAAVIVVVALAIGASASAIYAIRQQSETNQQRAAAEQNATEAAAQRDIANQQTAVAEELAREARIDALSGSSISQLDADPELALLLATEALQSGARPSALSAIHQALQQHRVLFQISMPRNTSPVIEGAVGGMNPAGDLVALTTGGHDLEVWKVGDDQALWTVHTDGLSAFTSVRFTDDGRAVVALVADLTPGAILIPDRLEVYDSGTGQQQDLIFLDGCGFDLFPSAMSPYVNLDASIPWVFLYCTEGGRVDAGLIDPVTGSFTVISDIDRGFADNTRTLGVPTIDSTGRRFAVGSTGPGQVTDLETGEVIFSFDGGISTLSADGSLLLARGQGVSRPLELWDLVAHQRLWAFPKSFTRAWFSGDETKVYGVSRDGSTYVLNAANGEQVFRLKSGQGVPLAATMSIDGNRLATFSTDFTARLWDIGAMRSEDAPFVGNSQPRVHVAASADHAAGVAAVWGGARYQEASLWETTVVEVATGETIVAVAGGVPALSPDGTRLAYRAVETIEVADEDLKARGEPGVHPLVGPVRIIDVRSGELVVEIDLQCRAFLMTDEAVPSAGCRLSSGGLGWDLEFSPDGSLLGMADSYSDLAIVWNAATGEIAGSDPLAGGNQRAVAFTPDQQQVVFLQDVGGSDKQLRVYDLDPFKLVRSIALGGGRSFAEMMFSPDGSLLVGADNGGDIVLFDTTTWELVEPISAHQGSVLDVAMSPNSALIASAGEDAFLRVWDLGKRSVITEIRFDVDEISNVEFIDDAHLFITSGSGSNAIIITLDPDELLHIARSRINRSFTQAECTTYSIDPCPTLEDIKSGSA